MVDAILHAQLDSHIELMLLVLLNAQLDMFLMVQFVNYQFKHAHLDNSTMLKMEFVLLVLIHAQSVNTLLTIVQLAQLDSLLLQTNVHNQLDVDQENTELLQDHAQHAHKNVLIVSVPLNVLLAPQDMFITELIVF